MIVVLPTPLNCYVEASNTLPNALETKNATFANVHTNDGDKEKSPTNVFSHTFDWLCPRAHVLSPNAWKIQIPSSFSIIMASTFLCFHSSE